MNLIRLIDPDYKTHDKVSENQYDSQLVAIHDLKNKIEEKTVLLTALQ